MVRNKLFSSMEVVKFVMGGNAYFTIVNPITSVRFTYRVSRKENEDGTKSPYFVSVLTGPDNWSNYRYLGVMFEDGTFRYGKKSKISRDATSAKAITWFLNSLTKEDVQTQVDRIEFWHEGRCCVCGRKLTVPESIESGIGPVCGGRI